MSKAPELSVFVREALANGAGRPVIRSHLLQAGWSETEVDTALASWLDPTSILPPAPRPLPSPSAREALFYTLKFLALLVVVWHVLDIGLEAIRDHFSSRPPHISPWSIATLIVFTPVFLGLHIYSQRLIRHDAGTRRSPARIWLGNTSLFFCALALLGSATTLLGSWLNGALSLQLSMQIFFLVVVSALLGLFFRFELRTGNRET